MSRRIAALLLLCGCGTDGGLREYRNNDLQLLTAYAAKEICSCVFVMGQTDEFCARWAKASPDLKTFTIDRGGKTVEAQAVIYFGARARYVNARRGCMLE